MGDTPSAKNNNNNSNLPHITPLTPDFMTRLAEHTAKSFKWLDIYFWLNLIMIATALLAFVIFCLILVGLVSINPLTTSIFLISIAGALISGCLQDKLASFYNSFYNSYSVEEKFKICCPDGMHAHYSPRFKHSVYSDASETYNPHTDRHLRPYDRLGFFNTNDDVETFTKHINSVNTNGQNQPQ